MRTIALTLVICAPTVLAAGGVFDGADVVFLGEIHDHPAHHVRQAEIASELAPVALVFEMLTPDQAALVTPDLIADSAALEAALGWNQSGWPDFAMYYPIFAAAPEAAYFGAAVPRETAMEVMQTGIVAAFRSDAAAYGLAVPLDADMQAAQEALQFAAHCDAMPVGMMPMMVDIQRLRDAELAHAAHEAFDVLGGPVVVITGNGHARKDWGAPSYLLTADPTLSVAALGQGEDGASAPEGVFDLIETAPPVDRGDPCDAFR